MSTAYKEQCSGVNSFFFAVNIYYLAVYDIFPFSSALSILFGTKTSCTLAVFSFGK